MTDIVLNQRHPGGVMKQLGDAAGGVSYDQYAAGGPPEQLRVASGLDDALDQYAPGGPVRQIEVELEGGGSSGLDWVPANAVIHIDLVGGDPQGRAWVAGTGVVAVDTLLGSDPNTVSGWATTVYEPESLTADGYLSVTQHPFALIGATRTKFFAGCTMRVQTKDVGENTLNLSIPVLAADGIDNIVFRNFDGGGPDATANSANGPLSLSIPDIVNRGDGAINASAITYDTPRFEFAQNGSDPVAGTLDEVDSPPGNPLVAVLIECNEPVQSITLYDPLPSTAGLSELSELPAEETPAWVPEGAQIHIDLVGGDPQGRAWVAGTGVVAVDTLLGEDANTASGWSTSVAFDADNLVADGYVAPSSSPAFIGSARTKALAGATLVVRMKQIGETGPTTAFIITSADGNDLVELDLGWVTGTMDCSSYNGSLDEEYLGIVNTGEGVTNVFALTLTDTRWEAAANGTFCFAGVLDGSDRPAGNPMVATMMDAGGASLIAVQSITLYDPLPSTAGLSELSEVA